MTFCKGNVILIITLVKSIIFYVTATQGTAGLTSKLFLLSLILPN